MTAPSDEEMEDLAGRDLDRAHESLYFAARRYCAITEAGFVQLVSNMCAIHDPSFVHIGDAAEALVDAAERYAEAHERWLPYETAPASDDDEPDEQWRAASG